MFLGFLVLTCGAGEARDARAIPENYATFSLTAKALAPAPASSPSFGPGPAPAPSPSFVPSTSPTPISNLG